MDNKSKKSQADKFREAAKDVDTNDDEKQFDENLRKISYAKIGNPKSKSDKQTD